MLALKLSTGTVILDGPERPLVIKSTVSEYNKNHDEDGKFATGGKGGVPHTELSDDMKTLGGTAEDLWDGYGEDRENYMDALQDLRNRYAKEQGFSYDEEFAGNFNVRQWQIESSGRFGNDLKLAIKDRDPGAMFEQNFARDFLDANGKKTVTLYRGLKEAQSKSVSGSLQLPANVESWTDSKERAKGFSPNGVVVSATFKSSQIHSAWMTNKLLFNSTEREYIVVTKKATSVEIVEDK